MGTENQSFKTFKPFKLFNPSDNPEIVLNDWNDLNPTKSVRMEQIEWQQQ